MYKPGDTKEETCFRCFSSYTAEFINAFEGWSTPYHDCVEILRDRIIALEINLATLANAVEEMKK